MQVLLSKEFGYDLKSQVEKSTRRVSGKPRKFAVAADQPGHLQQVTTSILHPLSSLRSQDLSPESIQTMRTL